MIDWHARYVQQAAWTRSLRIYLFTHPVLANPNRVLEVGCGTGAILADYSIPGLVHGLDRDLDHLAVARGHVRAARLTCGDALALPYASKAFDITFCHFLLLWVRNPLQALREMERVTRPGGAVLALAEPDYEHRQDEPAALAPIGRQQVQALRQQGADPVVGQHLASLFPQAGIEVVEAGTLASQAKPAPSPKEREQEWAVLTDDLAGIIPEAELLRLKKLDEEAWERGERVLNVPTYYVWGRTKTGNRG
jgi:SAM-dependent methyltransferase